MYLDGGGRRSQTATALHIHPNTLDYRLRKIQEITGLNPQFPQDLETLSMALAAWMLRDARRSSGIR
ncbi:helix-turn-helix domain-containing protein [Actinoplanes sp. CA-252034]|uniref:helix-turn-helix domain-containing protein n=1 Tax=Actinoplanes sp. CA-252034 TaxID=3239906 RepID=UPI003D9997A9